MWAQNKRELNYVFLTQPILLKFKKLSDLSRSLFGTQDEGVKFKTSIFTHCHITEDIGLHFWRNCWCLHDFELSKHLKTSQELYYDQIPNINIIINWTEHSKQIDIFWIGCNLSPCLHSLSLLSIVYDAFFAAVYCNKYVANTYVTVSMVLIVTNWINTLLIHHNT